MKTRGLRYLPALVVALALTLAGSPLWLGIPPAFFWAGVIASVLIIILAIRDVISE